ncbi:MAG: DUF4367 domain-containing protein [Ruminococcaceae bacterium]|nr:DUF4367 domain-containing protein [Oscillospiraceae bacterium]
MPEKQRNLAVVRQTRLSQIQKHLEELTPDELQTEYDSFFLNAADEDLDLELLDLYLKQLDKVSPMEPEITAEESLKNFRDKHGLLLESLEPVPEVPKKRRTIRIITIAVAAALVMGLMAIQVSGVNWMGSFARWTSELFGFSTRDYEVTKEWNPEYDGLREAMEELGITEKIAPKYLPEGYREVDVSVDSVGRTVVAKYISADNSIMISVDIVQGSEGILVEKNIEDPEVYVAGNIKHYIMTNSDTDQFVAAWQNGDYNCAIYCVPTRDILIRMIDSIYTEEENET